LRHHQQRLQHVIQVPFRHGGGWVGWRAGGWHTLRNCQTDYTATPRRMYACTAPPPLIFVQYRRRVFNRAHQLAADDGGCLPRQVVGGGVQLSHSECGNNNEIHNKWGRQSNICLHTVCFPPSKMCFTRTSLICYVDHVASLSLPTLLLPLTLSCCLLPVPPSLSCPLLALSCSYPTNLSARLLALSFLSFFYLFGAKIPMRDNMRRRPRGAAFVRNHAVVGC